MDSLRRLVLTPLLVGIHAAYLVSERLQSDVSSSSQAVRRSPRSPRHVGFSLVTDEHVSGNSRDLSKCIRRSEEKGKGKQVDLQWTSEEGMILSCVTEAVQWAMENGADEISLWNEEGLLQAVMPGLLTILVPSPPSPPASGTRSPPSYEPDYHFVQRRMDGSIASLASEIETETENDHVEGGLQGGVQTFTVWPDIEHMISGDMRRKPQIKPLTVHILSNSMSDGLLANITKEIASTDVALEEIDIERIDGLVRDALHFQNDPDLLIVHNMSGSLNQQTDMIGGMPWRTETWKYRMLKRFFPTENVELRGYPFWMLRITEIHHSSPSSTSAGPEGNTKTCVPGIHMNSWNPGLARWQGVEQRLGR